MLIPPNGPYADLNPELKILRDSPPGDLSSRLRVAKWLIEDVGVGNIFTSQELRLAVPGVAQVDRRLRDLRKCGWVISLRRDDGSIPLNCRRLDVIGGLEPDVADVSDRVRRQVFDRDNHSCVICGIAGGEAYANGQIARLEIGHIRPLAQRGTNEASNLRTECHRCNGGLRDRQRAVVAPEAVQVAITNLTVRDKRQLLQWIENNRREPTDAERAYLDFRQLSANERARIRDDLHRAVVDHDPR